MRKIRMGIIGTGLAFERLHYPAYQELADRFEIVALCDREPEKARTWAERLGLDRDAVYDDYHQLTARGDLDAVDIMVPIEENFEVTEAVARAWAGKGRAIICEKPLAPTLEQSIAAAELPQQYGIPIMIAENYRYNEEVNKLRDLVRTEKIGKTVYFIQNYVSNFPADMRKDTFARTEWRQHPDYPAGDLLDGGIHQLAGLRHIFGAVKNVHAVGRRQDDDFSPCAVFNVNLDFWSGVTGQFTYYDAGREPQRPLVGLRIFGTRGEIYLEERDCGIINVALNDGGAEQIPYTPRRGYYNELVNFHQAFTGQEPLAVTPEMELGDAKTVFAILQSLRGEEVVRVDDGPAYVPDYNRQQRQIPRHLQ
ncbi:MAG: Gfo/Idh/MocA family protein [Bacteroidota bacterium]